MDRDQLDGKVILITGASSGIGAAAATRLAAAGASVVLTARRADKLDRLAKQIRDDGGAARALTCDIADRGSVASMIEDAIDSFGHVDALLNNAGVMPNAPVDQARLDDWELMVDVNIKGLLYCTHALLKHLMDRPAGHVVNIGSTAGRRLLPTGAVYCGTKHFVHAFSEGLRNEVTGSPLRVTIVAPGLTRTELHGHIPHEDSRRRLEHADFDWLQPDDVARAVE